jgi:hypothetical protein
LESLAQGRQVFGFEIADGKNGGFRAHGSSLGETLTNPTRLRNRRAALRSSISLWKFLHGQNFLDESSEGM